MRTHLLQVFFAALCLAFAQSARAQTLYVYIQQPGTDNQYQSEDLTGTGFNPANVETANFNGDTTGTYTGTLSTNIGTFNSGVVGGTGKYAIVAADQYGGAGGTGNYISIGAQPNSTKSISITLNNSTNFLGLWWSAADTNNVITLYNNGTLVGTIDDAEIQNLLPNTSGTTITALNGTKYLTQSYYGNPNTAFAGDNNGQPYFYVDIVLQGATFNEIEYSNSGQTSTGFETDNWSIYNGTINTVNIPTDDVLIVPEPSRYAAISAGIIFCLVAFHRLLMRRRQG